MRSITHGDSHCMRPPASRPTTGQGSKNCCATSRVPPWRQGACGSSKPATDRRYKGRPPLAAGRLQRIEADHLTFRLKTPWSDGTTHLLLSPLEWIEKLAALIPPPRLNLVRYHGILAPNARDRRQVVPGPPVPTATPAPGSSPVTPLSI